MTSHDRLALSLVTEPGDARLRDLLRAHDHERVLLAITGGTRLAGVRLPEAWLERGRQLDGLIDQTLTAAEATGLRWITPGHKHWPRQLDDLDHALPLQGTAGAPLGLWVRGSADLAELCRKAAAIVGARDCTTYGAECASELGSDVADAGWTVVSGAAYGIDVCAHRGALAMSKPTVAVLACGADIDYPRAHAALLGRIAEDGVVVSEQAPSAGPMKRRFLSRNRIIAALSAGTVVIEAALRSGSLNTLNWADQLGRVTMGVPGPVTSQASGGVHAALRDGKAILVTSGSHVVEELGGLGSEPVSLEIVKTEFDRLSSAARVTLDGLDWRQNRSLLEITAAVRLGADEVREALALLERQGLAGRSGAGWVLIRRADTA